MRLRGNFFLEGLRKKRAVVFSYHKAAVFFLQLTLQRGVEKYIVFLNKLGENGGITYDIQLTTLLEYNL